jgi:hypothetical protein
MVDGLAKVILRTLLRAGCYVASRVVLENYAIGYNKAAKCERERERECDTYEHQFGEAIALVHDWMEGGWLVDWMEGENK